MATLQEYVVEARRAHPEASITTLLRIVRAAVAPAYPEAKVRRTDVTDILDRLGLR